MVWTIQMMCWILSIFELWAIDFYPRGCVWKLVSSNFAIQSTGFGVTGFGHFSDKAVFVYSCGKNQPNMRGGYSNMIEHDGTPAKLSLESSFLYRTITHFTGIFFCPSFVMLYIYIHIHTYHTLHYIPLHYITLQHYTTLHYITYITYMHAYIFSAWHAAVKEYHSYMSSFYRPQFVMAGFRPIPSPL